MSSDVTFSNTTFFNVSFPNATLSIPCTPEQQQPQHVLYQLANICFILSYLSPGRKRGLLFMHSLLIVGESSSSSSVVVAGVVE
ncbi:UNVERIFIED_CONTAM: hypothetical protein NCL1_44886 [Trichonephila clavipes]